jgi:hypothetical protein
MSNQSMQTEFLAGDFISEDAVRGAFSRRPRRPWRTTALQPQATAADPVSPTTPPVPPRVGSRPLRRWSVAELIARAVPAPSVDRVRHC